MKKKLSALRWLLPWLKPLAGVAVVLIGGITVILILVMGTGQRMSGLAVGGLAGAWTVAVMIYLYFKARKGQI